MPQGLHLIYEEDFLMHWRPQVPKVFSDPWFLPSMANSVYDLVTPSIPSEIPPFSSAPEKSISPDRFVGGQVAISTLKMSLPASPLEITNNSDTESNGTVDLKQGQSQSQESLSHFS